MSQSRDLGEPSIMRRQNRSKCQTNQLLRFEQLVTSNVWFHDNASESNPKNWCGSE
jgi:hypothetical protein